MNHYCTYFDRGYLAVGLALWDSLRRFDPAAELSVLALDDDTAAVLRQRGESGLRTLVLAELLAADPELAAARAERSKQEFIFTLTPCLLLHLLRVRPEAQPLVYLDADLYFFSSPAPLHAELGTGSVLVVPHRFPPWHDDSALYGRFNVGALAFRGDPNGLACLEWWRRRCLESCALTVDGEHFGDQKYLDAWPARFDGVIESAHPGVNVAPWNWARHRFELQDGALKVDGQPLVVFHFAQFRPIGNRWCDSGQLEYGIMPLWLRSRLYGEYWAALERAEASVRAVAPQLPALRRTWGQALSPWPFSILRVLWGQCWRRTGPWLVAGRFGLGRFSGRAMSVYRKIRRRR
jgi:hypothetical protein